jgi:hypothetical protein
MSCFSGVLGDERQSKLGHMICRVFKDRMIGVFQMLERLAAVFGLMTERADQRGWGS